VIGYYVHHHGRGHLHRAVSIAAALAEVPGAPSVTGLSSLPRPAGWHGGWVQLDRDDAASAPHNPTAFERLHWVPEGDVGLRMRMAAIAQWIAEVGPSVMVVDVSVEVTLMARLLGVPVIPVVLPGDRSDAAHTLGYDVAQVILAAWPAGASNMVGGLSAQNLAKLTPVGAISRFAVADADAGRSSAESEASASRHVVVLSGALSGALVDSARRDAAGWQFTVLGAEGMWVDDPQPILRSADVVITHAGQNAIAEVAALRRPAIVIPQIRPHGEQLATARVLAALPGIPAIVVTEFPTSGWSALLDRAAGLDGSGWSFWADGNGARRAAGVILAESEAAHRCERVDVVAEVPAL
jgi:hypothetical protein